MGLEEAQAAPHTKIGHATYVIGKCFSVGWPLENPFCSSAPWKWLMPLQDITQWSGDQVWTGWHTPSMSSTEASRRTLSISSRTRSWSRKLPLRAPQPPSRRPSERPRGKATADLNLGLDYSGLLPTKSIFHKSQTARKKLSLTKRCDSDEESMSDWPVLHCYCSLWGNVYRGSLWPYLRLICVAVVRFQNKIALI